MDWDTQTYSSVEEKTKKEHKKDQKFAVVMCSGRSQHGTEWGDAPTGIDECMGWGLLSQC